jgi:hypothetical protein
MFERGDFRSTKLEKSVISEALSGSRNFSTRSVFDVSTTIFLSHKHKDLEDEKEAAGVIEMLEDYGAKIYIDSMDNRMPGETSGETAARIKDIIRYCNKFILLATETAIQSFWCNWELGLGDVHKYIDHIALVPVKEKDTFDSQYKGNEYLQIYPQIVYRKGNTPNLRGEYLRQGYYVRSPHEIDGFYTVTTLDDWLNNK